MNEHNIRKPAALYPCHTCRDRFGGYDDRYYSAEELTVVDGKIQCDDCLEHYPRLEDVIHFPKYSNDDEIVQIAEQVLPDLPEPLYFCIMCDDYGDALNPVHPPTELWFFKDEVDTGYACSECLSNHYINPENVGPSLAEVMRAEDESE